MIVEKLGDQVKIDGKKNFWLLENWIKLVKVRPISNLINKLISMTEEELLFGPSSESLTNFGIVLDAISIWTEMTSF